MSYLQTVTYTANSNRDCSIFMYAQPQSSRQIVLFPQGAAMASEEVMPVFLNLPISNITPTTSTIPITQVPVVGSPSYYPSNGQIIFAAPGIYSARPLFRAPFPEGCYNSHPTPFPNPAPPAHRYVPGLQVVHHPPGYSTYIPHGLKHSHKEVSGLEKRCGSNSSVECTPGRLCHSSSTHPYQSSSHTIAVDRPPFGSTPSQLPGPPVVYQSSKTAKTDTRIPIGVDIDALLSQAPSIPPGAFTALGNLRTLDQSLSNLIHGNRNVYIRGLHPTTDDDTLAAYVNRFGRIETCKAIIDVSTGACKGFGFAKYFNVQCSELCIRGFHKLGYEVGFAQDSLNARLKAKGDELSTNLYVSNLPMNMTKSEFCAIFKGYKVLSSKTLPSTSSNSSGVGFARFESRKDCDEIIKKFHGRPICAGGHSIQIRYADTPAQKDLKRVTTERRQFQARKHNVSAYRDDTSSPSPALTSPTLRRTESADQLSLSPGHSWKRGTSLQRSTSALSSETRKVSLPETSPADSRIDEASNSTSTVLDDGSGDNGVACHFDSPVVVCGDSMNSATHTVEGHAKQQQPT